MYKRVISLFIAICFILLLFGCTPSDVGSDRVSIVTTIFSAYDFARAVAGDICEVSMLIPAGGEVHSFEPTPQDMIKIEDCDLFIYNGGESDEWVNTLLESEEYKDLSVLRMTDCVTTYNEEVKEGMDADGDGEEDEIDEHVWTSPRNAIAIIQAIADEISVKDPQNADKYHENALVYVKKLQNVDEEFRAIAREINNPTLIFADRFPMRYFAEEYGFDYYAAFPGCSAQTEPSAKTVTFLIEKVREENIPAVFCIEFSNGRLADNICGETGAKEYTLHSCHNVSSADFKSGRTYCDIMEENAKTLREAFGI